MKSFIAKLTLGAAAFALAGAANAKVPPTPPEDPGAVHSYILLDRTGSMSDIWEEALGSVNAYAASVGEADEGETDDLSRPPSPWRCSTYQDGMQFDVLRTAWSRKDWQTVTDDEVSARAA
jgi:hypothetical protein